MKIKNKFLLIKRLSWVLKLKYLLIKKIFRPTEGITMSYIKNLLFQHRNKVSDEARPKTKFTRPLVFGSLVVHITSGQSGTKPIKINL